jgi:hypothetical protein
MPYKFLHPVAHNIYYCESAFNSKFLIGCYNVMNPGFGANLNVSSTIPS